VVLILLCFIGCPVIIRRDYGEIMLLPSSIEFICKHRLIIIYRLSFFCETDSKTTAP